MISILKRAALLFEPAVWCLLCLALTVGIPGHSAAQAGGDTIYGVTALDVAPSAVSQGLALLHDVGWPNRFVIYEGCKDQSSYYAIEKGGHTAEFRNKLKAIAGVPY